MSRNRLSALIAVSVLAAACSTGGSSNPSGSLTPAASPAASASSAPATATRLDVKLTDALKIEPAEMRGPVGQPVTFVVTNVGATDHEFYVGDEAAQAKHEAEMGSMGGTGGMTQDEANGIALKPGETKELVMTFDAPGTTIAGCHTTGHYAAGMKAMITIGS